MKKVIPILVFGLLFVLSISRLNDIFVEKYANRYYMLSKELEKIDDIDVQVYGSCHAYTSFHAKYFTEKYGVSSYNMSNSSEVIPATYLRMYERFKKDAPKVALVEIWGINAYDTYLSTELIMDEYFRCNVEDVPFSLEKLEVINDYDTLDVLEDNIALAKYKDRLINFSLTDIDFDYSFEKANLKYNADEKDYFYEEMKNRFGNQGYKAYASAVYDDYLEQQATVSPEEKLAVEADVKKYLDKIVKLCKEKNVTLIFYRAPYCSSENELKRANWMREYCEENNVFYYDLEPAIEWNYGGDFYDYEHLGYNGAIKATDFLGDIIIEKINQ